jgi:hypothetical protein
MLNYYQLTIPASESRKDDLVSLVTEKLGEPAIHQIVNGDHVYHWDGAEELIRDAAGKVKLPEEVVIDKIAIFNSLYSELNKNGVEWRNCSGKP